MTTLRPQASEFARELFHFDQTVEHQHDRLHQRARRAGEAEAVAG